MLIKARDTTMVILRTVHLSHLLMVTGDVKVQKGSKNTIIILRNQ